MEGHRRGVESTRECVRAAADMGIGHLTLFSFSSENWKRPPREVEYLMGLLRRFIRRDLAELHQNNIKVRVIGSEEGVPPDLLTMFRDAVALTSGNDGLQLIIAFNYGARDEIVCSPGAERHHPFDRAVGPIGVRDAWRKQGGSDDDRDDNRQDGSAGAHGMSPRRIRNRRRGTRRGFEILRR